MPKGCLVTIRDTYYEAGQDYCRRFCEESGVLCDGPENPPGCTMCVESDYGILHRVIRLGPCQEIPPGAPGINCDEWVVGELVVVAGNVTETKNTCRYCVAIEPHPCYEEYLDYRFQILFTRVYIGPPVYCRCPNG